MNGDDFYDKVFAPPPTHRKYVDNEEKERKTIDVIQTTLGKTEQVLAQAEAGLEENLVTVAAKISSATGQDLDKIMSALNVLLSGTKMAHHAVADQNAAFDVEVDKTAHLTPKTGQWKRMAFNSVWSSLTMRVGSQLADWLEDHDYL